MTDGQLWFFTFAALLVVSAVASVAFGLLRRRFSDSPHVLAINGPSEWFPVGGRLYLPDGTYKVLGHPGPRELEVVRLWPKRWWQR